MLGAASLAITSLLFLPANTYAAPSLQGRVGIGTWPKSFHFKAGTTNSSQLVYQVLHESHWRRGPGRLPKNWGLGPGTRHTARWALLQHSIRSLPSMGLGNQLDTWNRAMYPGTHVTGARLSFYSASHFDLGSDHRPNIRENICSIVLNVFRSCYLNQWFCKFSIYFSMYFRPLGSWSTLVKSTS